MCYSTQRERTSQMCGCCWENGCFLLILQSINHHSMSRVLSLHHIVINTKNRHMTISMEHCEELYRFITAIVKRNNSRLYRIGGIENHIHILVNLNPTVTLSHLLWDIKRSSSDWMKKSGLFPQFEGWGKEYAAFSVSQSHQEAVIDYIKNQIQHHKGASFEQEYQRIVERNGMEWIPDLLT